MKQIPNKVVLHCSATKNFKTVPAKTIDEWHKARGWSGIGYHVVIQPDGQIESGRPLNQQGAHTSGQNKDSLGVCMIGTDKWTKEAFASLRYTLDGFRMTYNIQPWDVFGHYEFTNKKTCPNMRMGNVISWLITQNDDPIHDYIGKSPYN